jgi:pimeloyl-ACP methyl ester carboxylesterase
LDQELDRAGLQLIRMVSKLLPVCLLLGACSSPPLNPWTADSPPLALVPVADAGVDDQRGRFREIFCEVLESRGEGWPDYQPCEEALTLVAKEPPGTGQPVNTGTSQLKPLVLMVPGVGWECIEGWVTIEESMQGFLQSYEYGAQLLRVDGLSSSANNARQIRDAIATLPPETKDRPIVLIGYSKGAADILEAVVAYPELPDRVVAVVSAAGAIGGSPLANTVDQKDLNVMLHFPGSTCSEGDGGALESLRPATRRAWLANHPLPEKIKYYSVVTYPYPDRISSVLGGSYRTLSKVDARNDSQVLYYDQVIPGSTLLAFVNADHWALAVPIARSHNIIGATLVNRNNYPREALLEAVIRFVEADLE